MRHSTPPPPTGSLLPNDLSTASVPQCTGSSREGGRCFPDGTTASSSSVGVALADRDGEQKFRRVDSDAETDVAGGRRRSTAAFEAVFCGGGGGCSGWWRRTSGPSDSEPQESVVRRHLEARALEASRGRLQAALLARDPDGYSRELARKRDLEALIAGLAKLGDAAARARAWGLSGVSRMLDDQRTGVRRSLDTTLAAADEAATLDGLAAARHPMEGALAMSAEEAACEAAAAHAALPWYARWVDRNVDGVVSHREKRLWVMLGPLALATVTCIVLAGLLVRYFLTDQKSPITTVRFEDVEELPVPRMSFCVEVPAFSKRLRTKKFTGPPLFGVSYVRLPPGVEAFAPRAIEYDPIDVGLLRELSRGPINCSDAEGVLSTRRQGDFAYDCVYCFESVADELVLHRGETSEVSKRTTSSCTSTRTRPLQGPWLPPETSRKRPRCSCASCSAIPQT